MVKKIICGMLLIISFKSLSVGSSTVISVDQKNILNKYGYEVKVVDFIEDTQNWGFNPAGLFLEADKTILLDSEWVEWSFNHEYGHFIDSINYNISTSKSFGDIYNLEKDRYTFLNFEYARSSTIEYFASAYKQYLEQPQQLKEMCKETYNFIDRLENK